ncbi:Ff.00g066020.m01.CDS01 [Fusarium sp. VM40]|nr:Ff.00g066020.m01.CDS01 [Fusarium sp. VM40]
MSSADQNVGAIISLTPPDEGDNIWEAKQVDIARSLPPGDIQGRQSIDWSFGPIKITGYVDTNTFEIGVSISIVGINVGNIFGNLKDGVGLKVNLFVAKGEIRIYLKNGNEIWVHLDIKVTFDGSFEGDYKILSI